MIPITSLTLEQPERLPEESGWFEHVPFMFWLVEALRPRCFVELGVHTGTSYCAACQAIDHLRIDCRAYGIDTFEGDAHAGFYGRSVGRELAAYHDPRYGGFSRLVTDTFDNAVGHFAAGEIDLLHIDGLHTYEAVRHDFETWRPKLADDAVVIFHDTNVRERGFGVFRLWSELGAAFTSFEFLHGNGLGVLCMGTPRTPPLRHLFDCANSEAGRTEMRGVFARLGRRVSGQRHDADTPMIEWLSGQIAPHATESERGELHAAMEIARYRSLLAHSPENPALLSQLSLAFAHANRDAEAIDAIERAIAVETEASRYRHLANLQHRNGNRTAALEAMRLAIENEPDNADLVQHMEKLAACETLPAIGGES